MNKKNCFESSAFNIILYELKIIDIKINWILIISILLSKFMF